MQALKQTIAVIIVSLVGLTPSAMAQDGDYQQQAGPPVLTPQGPGPAPGPGQAIPAANPYSPMVPSVGAVGVVPAIAVPGYQAPGPMPTNLGGGVSTLGPYTLGPDDVVYIDVQLQPEFSGTFVVGHDGMIQYGIIGDVKVDGLTKDELAQALAERLKQYVRFPQIHVTITGFNSKAIYILGRVASPGKYAMRGDVIKLRDALVAAGLEGQYAALGRVRIIKTDPVHPKKRVVNLGKVVYQGKTAEDIDLVNGDVIVVPTTLWGYVAIFFRSVFGPVARVARWAAI